MNASNQIRLSLPRADFELSVDLLLPAQGITAIYGASGSGKTSLLRAVAGLERAKHSLIRIAGQTWQDASAAVFVHTWQRSLGYVFQEASLLTHLDVRGNLEFGLRRTQSMGADSPAQAQQILNNAVALMGIGHLLQRKVLQLSGGERQRVAICRAVATQPSVLLMDEPLASLGQEHKTEILPWLARLRDELQIPMLYVTHSADEVARLADHLVVLEHGQVKASGGVASVLSQVVNPVVVGEDAGALLSGQVAATEQQWHLARVDFAGGSVWLRDAGLTIGTPVRIRILARDVSLSLVQPEHTSIQNHIACVVQSITADAHPSQALLSLKCGDSVLLARLTQRAVHALGLQLGTQVWAQVKSVALIE